MTQPMIAVLMLAASTFATAATPAAPDRFTTADGLMSFWTPSAPRPTVKDFASPAGLPMRQTTYAIEGPEYLILVAVLELSGPPTTGDEAALMDPMLDDMRKGFGPGFQPDMGQGLTDISLGPNGLKGKQVSATVDGSIRVKLRVYLGACRVYSIQVAHAVGDARTAEVGERVLKSVAIKDPAETKTCEVKR